ncbi:hypothetical protein, partial [Enterococcus cecorum]
VKVKKPYHRLLRFFAYCFCININYWLAGRFAWYTANDLVIHRKRYQKVMKKYSIFLHFLVSFFNIMC